MAPPSAIHVEGVTDTEAVVLPGPLSVNDISLRRASAPKLVAGTAAFTSSDMFKNPSIGKPKAKRWDHLLSNESKLRQASSLKQAAKYLKNPGIISLGGGLPCPEYFPIEQLSVKVPSVPHFSEEETKTTGAVITAGKYDISEGHGTYDLAVALNYGQGTGAAQLLRFVTEHTELVCNPPYADWHCALTVGSTSALEQSYRMFTEKGDSILTEEYTFATAVETAIPLGVKMIGVKVDAEGLLPDSMDEILSNWDEKARGGRKPRLLYTVPSGQNPTGATQSAQRRHAIYHVAQKHDVFILEDEPYYFLQMQPYTGRDAPDPPAPANTMEFLQVLVPTYLSMDIDGRVMRMDSFSKVIAPGTRTGWITASEQIVERFVRHNEVSNQNPSGISQIVLYKLLDEHWSHDGYLKWLINLRLEYTRRRNVILEAAETHLPTDIVSWNPPAAGMFLWFEIDWKKHPDASSKTFFEIEDEIFLACINKGVLLTKGSWFAAERDLVPEKMFLRATFAAATSDSMNHAIERFGVAVREEFGIK